MKSNYGCFPTFRYPLEQNRWAEWRYAWEDDARIDVALVRGYYPIFRPSEPECFIVEQTARHAMASSRTLADVLGAIGRFLWQLYHNWLPEGRAAGHSGRPKHGLT